MDWLFQTDNSFSYVFLRFGLALTFFMHGTQHALGWHGGKGPKAQVANWRDKYHIPAAMGVLALAIELFAVVSFTLGFLVRPAAFGLAVFIAFALFLSHWSNGFFLASGPGIHAGAFSDGDRAGVRRRGRLVDRWVAQPVRIRSRHFVLFATHFVVKVSILVLSVRSKNATRG